MESFSLLVKWMVSLALWSALRVASPRWTVILSLSASNATSSVDARAAPSTSTLVLLTSSSFIFSVMKDESSSIASSIATVPLKVKVSKSGSIVSS
ncbi:hypothetical protein BX600DRAFT_471224 [Xylariales sp. PMI_506]|nr:hypothetical protein BX600DRAFT_471224 [Xylariales sp. PMI_506]